jgi:hypothetical protein
MFVKYSPIVFPSLKSSSELVMRLFPSEVCRAEIDADVDMETAEEATVATKSRLESMKKAAGQTGKLESKFKGNTIDYWCLFLGISTLFQGDAMA